MNREKEKYMNILESLSQKLKTPRHKWRPEEMKVAKLFKKEKLTVKNLKNAKENLRFQTGLKSRFEEGIKRSIQYLPELYPIVRDSLLPRDLILLPHVESSYNANAGSRAGALGLWQIMPFTMKFYGGSGSVQKRTDPSFSTKIAMKILKADYDKIQNWPLTLTAYNYGVNGILKAIEKTGSRNLCRVIDYYESPSFKFASSNFYAQFLAARKVALNRYKLLSQKGKSASKTVLQKTFFSIGTKK
jgi:membrane-bound lytic murein transglycosylase D